MEVTIYSLPTCPKCQILKTKLSAKNVSYKEISDIDVLQQEGIQYVPQMKIEDSLLMDFVQANAWINNLEVE